MKMHTATQLSRHRRPALLVAVMLAAALALAVFLSGRVQSAPVVAPITNSEEATATKFALEYANIASADGKGIDSSVWPQSVVSADAVATTRRQAASFSGSQSDSDARVLVATVDGEFTLVAPGPEGSKDPSGRQIVLVIDPSTGAVTDVGITQDVRELNPLGQPVSLR